MKGRARAFGAVSIVNAIASGSGATAGVTLSTTAEVGLEKKPGRWRVWVNGKPSQSRLAVGSTSKVLERLGLEPDTFSATISTRTDIPIGVGLKSSSSSSVAVALATLAALGEKRFEAEQVLRWSAEASLECGASITGALDDAASCLLGGINHARNLEMRLVSSARFDEPLRVVILVPKKRSRRSSITLPRIQKFSRLAEVAFALSMKGDHWTAMTLNGLLYSAIYQYDASRAMEAIKAGAMGAGLSGTGPAVAAVFQRDHRSSAKTLIRDWRALGGSVIVTSTNNDRGGILPE